MRFTEWTDHAGMIRHVMRRQSDKEDAILRELLQ